MIKYRRGQSNNPLFLLMLAFIFTFASIDTWTAMKSTIVLHDLFLMGFMKPQFFSLFEIVLIIVIVLSMKKYSWSYYPAPKILKVIFWLACVSYFLKMLNPNNNSNHPILGMPLFSDVSNYTFLLLIYFSFFLRKDGYIAFVTRFFYYTSFIMTIRIIYLFVMWGVGKGNYFIGVNATLLEGDTLFFIACLQVIFFALFLIKREKKYLFLWILYLLFQGFSFRRSGLGVVLLSNTLIYILYLLKGKGVRRKLILVTSIFFIFFGVGNIDKLSLPDKYEIYILRFVSAIPGMSQEKTGLFNDSGHWQQTSLTIHYALQTLGFWGHGYGKSETLHLRGQSSAIHNVYAAAWAFYGFYMLLFYLIIIFVVLLKFLNIFIFEHGTNTSTYLLQLSIAIFLLMWFAVLSTNPLIIIDEIKMEVFWVTLFAVLMRIGPEDIESFATKRRIQYA